jgi:pyruvate/oxaloacetate carboxyltransferase
MSRVQITDVVLRDGHQSLIATRMRTEDMLPVCAALDKDRLLVAGSVGRCHLRPACAS